MVAAEQQGHGLGRLLKHAQREVALGHGMTRMRWTYDPFEIRNAHFNLDVLGARGRWFAPDMYGPGTDRVVVEWDLTREHRSAEPDAATARLVVPAKVTDQAGTTSAASLRRGCSGRASSPSPAVGCRTGTPPTTSGRCDDA